MTLLVRDVMTIGVSICRDSETCGAVLARLENQADASEAVVVLDEDGMACGWLERDRLAAVAAPQVVAEIMREDIPNVPPDIPIEAAAQLMRDHGVKHLFLMHDWPGEPRPSAMISLSAIERRLESKPSTIL